MSLLYDIKEKNFFMFSGNLTKGRKIYKIKRNDGNGYTNKLPEKEILELPKVENTTVNRNVSVYSALKTHYSFLFY